MKDSRKAKDNHQKGIERVKGASKELKKGQGGKMGKVEKAHWKRDGGAMTPRKA